MPLIERNNIRDGDWIFEKVSDFSEFKSFSCGDKDLDEFIRHDAGSHKKEMLAETYALRRISEHNILSVAFCSFCNDAIQLSYQKKKELLPRKKRYPYQPAAKIARLGVQKEFQGNNIGSYLLNLSKQLFLHDNRTGCRFITVDAYNIIPAIRFYKKNGFQFLDEKDSERHTRIMYFDLKRLNI